MVIRLGEMLLQRKLITPEQLNQAFKEKQKSGGLLGKVLIKLGYVSEDQLLAALAEQLKIPIVKLKETKVELAALKMLPAKFAWYYKIIPLKTAQNKLVVATADPLRSLTDVEMLLGHPLSPVLAKEEEIVAALDKYYGVGSETIEKIIEQSPVAVDQQLQREAGKIEDIEELAEDASVVKLVNQIIVDAHKMRATDIHLEPYRDQVSLRYRVDGVLQEATVSADIIRLFPAIVSRIKIMSKLDIVERRLPQDGRAVVKIGREELDLRISIIPTRHGEGLAIRILPTKMLFSLERLGLESDDLKILQELVTRPNGIIFVTGPTGSGKTTTLYACLNTVKSVTNKIITIEDPIEYELAGISQIQVTPEIGFSFAQGLRSVLRHDPDIMMVGEVRDFETAELAIRIALTGHLIFSTLHTNDAAGAVARLLDIGIEPFLVASSVQAFIAQRLVRVICPECKVEDHSLDPQLKEQIMKEISQFRSLCRDAEEKALFALSRSSDLRFYKGRGCRSCNSTGFKQRTAIYEMLVVNKAIRQLILTRASADKIREQAISSGMKTLRLSGWKKILEGITTPDEIMRVTQTEE
ncbi:GspE/PulE family protein [Candidatus Omnitrophota bacterium]